MKKPVNIPLDGPHLKFCEGVVLGLPPVEAYAAAFPKCSPKSCPSKASRMLRYGNIQAEIARLRKAAEALPGSTVLKLAEKRAYLARVVRTPIGDIDHTSDLCQERVYTVGKDADSVKVKMPDKLRAIQIDNDLSGDGAEASANKALTGIMALAMELRK